MEDQARTGVNGFKRGAVISEHHSWGMALRNSGRGVVVRRIKKREKRKEKDRRDYGHAHKASRQRWNVDRPHNGGL